MRRRCSFDGCENPVNSQGLCQAHIHQRNKGQALRQITKKKRPSEGALEFFMRHINPSASGCWMWTGPAQRGYPQLRTKGAPWGRRANRAALFFFVGPPPSNRHFAIHSCDTPMCVNPAHLRWGTPKENTGDAISRDRISRGSSHPIAKLSEADVAAIRLRVASGELQRVVASAYGIRQSYVSRIVRREIWSRAP
jgi:hypothetical protein